MAKYKKAPQYMGKELKLYVAGGDKTIYDHEVLEGAKWDKFVGMGFLVRTEGDAPKKVVVAGAPAPAPADPPAPEKKVETTKPADTKPAEVTPPPPPKNEGTTTTSPASKVEPPARKVTTKKRKPDAE